MSGRLDMWVTLMFMHIMRLQYREEREEYPEYIDLGGES